MEPTSTNGYESYFEERWVLANASPGLGDDVANEMIASGVWAYPRSSRSKEYSIAIVEGRAGRETRLWRFIGALHPGTIKGREGWWLSESWAKELGYTPRSKLLRGREFSVGQRVRLLGIDANGNAELHPNHGVVIGLEPNFYEVRFTSAIGEQTIGLYPENELIDADEAWDDGSFST